MAGAAEGSVFFQVVKEGERGGWSRDRLKTVSRTKVTLSGILSAKRTEASRVKSLTKLDLLIIF
jgi:hypothetical protein